MIIDVVVLIVLFVSSLISFLRGFIREVLTIFGTMGAFFAAYWGGPMLSPSVAKMLGYDPEAQFENPQKLFGFIPYDLVASVAAYGFIFIVVVILLSLLSHSLAEAAKSVGLGAVDRSAGVLFGIVRAVLLLGLLNLPIYIFAKDAETRPVFINDAIAQSNAYFYIDQTSKFIAGFIPSDADEQIMQQAEDGVKALEQPVREKVIEQLTPAIPQQGQTPEGYSEEFRDKMDELFQQQE